MRHGDFDVPAVEANSWRMGLDRLLMGLATGPISGLVGGVAPQAGDTAGQADLLGRLASFVDTLFEQVRRLREPRALAQWARDLGRTLDLLFETEGEMEEEGLQKIRDALDHLQDVEERARVETQVSLEVLREHLERHLSDLRPGGRFLSGRITFCALKPMRTIPFRVVAVAGLDSSSFPRKDLPRSFDLMRLRPRLGDRSLRDDDRQLFLETLLATRQQLILTWVGRSQQDGSERAPSVVVDELLNVLERGFRSPDARPLRQHLVVEHRLHPFHPAYFGTGPLFSYSTFDLEAARATYGERLGPPRFSEPSPPPLPKPESEISTGSNGHHQVELNDLLDFWIHPSRHFCRRVLNLFLNGRGEVPEPSEPFRLDGLERYQLLQWMLHHRLHPEELTADELSVLRARGELPVAGLGKATLAVLRSRVDSFVARLPRHRPRPPRILDLEGRGFRLRGRLDDLTDQGQLRFRCAGLKPKDQLRAWILHLAWNCLPVDETDPVDRETLLIAEGQAFRFRALPRAEDLLRDLVEGFFAGRESPLPFFEDTSRRFAEQRRRWQDPRSRSTKEPMEAARDVWFGRGFGGSRFPAEAQDPYVRLCFRGRDPLAESAFPHWAEKMWTPLLDASEEAFL